MRRDILTAEDRRPKRKAGPKKSDRRPGYRRDRLRREPAPVLPPGVFPDQFSQQRIRIVRMLRFWEAHKATYPHRRDTYAVDLLRRQKAQNAVSPKFLPEFGHLRDRQQVLLGWMVLTCLIRGAKAARGDRQEWGELLGCCSKTAWTHLQDLVEAEWISPLPLFVKQKSHGKRNEVLHHRQKENWYQPGRKLLAAWKLFQVRQQAADVRFRRAGLGPTSGNAAQAGSSVTKKSYHPSPKGSESTNQKGVEDPKRSNHHITSVPVDASTVCDGENESPLATVEKAPSATANPRPASGGDTSTPIATVAACPKPARAYQDGGAVGPSSAVASRNGHMPITDDMSILEDSAIDIVHMRDMTGLYRSRDGEDKRDKGLGREMALALAKIVAANLPDRRGKR